MRCAKARGLIVLMHDGELTERESELAAHHLERCASCRRLAAPAPLPLRELRTAAPLRAADYAAVRAGVLAGLERDRRPLLQAFAFRLAAAAIAVAALIQVGTLLTTQPIAEPAPPAAAAIEPSRPIAPPPAVPPAVVVQADASEPDPVPPAPALPRATPAPATTLAALDIPQELRIQIQTEDPEIRIIWIVNPSVEFEPIFQEES